MFKIRLNFIATSRYLSSVYHSNFTVPDEKLAGDKISFLKKLSESLKNPQHVQTFIKEERKDDERFT